MERRADALFSRPPPSLLRPDHLEPRKPFFGFEALAYYGTLDRRPWTDPKKHPG